MKNIQISKEMIENNVIIPNNMRPKRFAVATNAMIIVEDSKTSEKSMLLYNYDPVNWNQLYPYFTSSNAMNNFKSERYGDLLEEFEAAISKNGFSPKNRINRLKKDLVESLSQVDIELVKSDVIKDEYWLKYSKSQDVWTIYLIEFFQLQSTATNLDKYVLTKDDKCLLSLSKEKVQDILDEAKYNEVPIVKNTLNILKDEELLNELMNTAITI